METLQVKKNDLITIAEFAKLVGKERQRIYQLIKEGEETIKVVEIAGRLFIDKVKTTYQ